MFAAITVIDPKKRFEASKLDAIRFGTSRIYRVLVSIPNQPVVRVTGTHPVCQGTGRLLWYL